MSKKATLEELIKRKEQGKLDKMQLKEVEVASLGLTFTVVKQPLTAILKLIDRYNGAEGLSNNFEMCKELIYMSIPLFQSQELQTAYECSEPFDIVPLVLDNNLGAIGELADTITEMYGIGNGGVVNQLKN